MAAGQHITGRALARSAHALRRSVAHAARQVVANWTIAMRAGDAPIAVSGIVTYVEGPSPWPWVALLVVLAGLTTLAAWSTRWGRWLSIALALLLASDVMHSFGTAAATHESMAAQLVRVLLAGLVTTAAWVVGVASIPSLQRNHEGGLVAAGGIGLVIAMFSGVTDVGVFSNSQVATVFPAVTARIAVAVAIGLGAGLVMATVVVIAAIRGCVRLPERRRHLLAEPLQRGADALGRAEVERRDDELVDAGVAVRADDVLHLGRGADDRGNAAARPLRSLEPLGRRRGRAAPGRSGGSSPGSRPRRSQWASSTCPFCASRSGRPQMFHSSAYCAAMRMVTFSPPPPMSSGTRSCTGLGAQRRVLDGVVLAVERRALVARAGRVMIWHASSSRRSRSPTVPKWMPVCDVLVLLPAGAEAEHQAPAADVVDGRGHVGQHRRVPVRVAGDDGADADPGTVAAVGREHRPALEHRVVVGGSASLGA